MLSYYHIIFYIYKYTFQKIIHLLYSNNIFKKNSYSTNGNFRYMLSILYLGKPKILQIITCNKVRFNTI